MYDTILHDGALTVELESSDTVIVKVAGRLPTLDDMARQRALNVYLAPNCEVSDISEDEQVWLDGQGEL